ncbi:MAG TPA: uracil-DNA glycosylase [Geothermobacteraceae bacterium]|nr:uracil-DNA glycosylase [Geothermobacteraceae bacterium]
MPENLQKELLQLAGQVRGLLEGLELAGIHQLPRTCEIVAASIAAPEAGAGETLAEIRADLGECCRCGLSEQRHKIVFGVGPERARLVFVGEAPGRDEDEQGEPFVGEAGKLLDRIILAMGMQRSDVYICNVIKCRPPRNRDPKPEEIAACEPFLKRQLKALQPEVIVTLGKFAGQALLRSETPISRLRGSWHEYQGIPLMPTFHPAYLLRNPASKREVWEDMKLVMQRLRSTAG